MTTHDPSNLKSCILPHNHFSTCRDLRKHLFGRYKRQAKKAGLSAPQDEPAEEERRSRRSRSPPREQARENSAERRARIAEWSRKFKEQGAAAS